MVWRDGYLGQTGELVAGLFTLRAVDRAELEGQRQVLALYRKRHKQLIAALNIRSYEPTEEEQEAYAKARVFWVREFPTMQKLFNASLEQNNHLQHALYVLRSYYERPRVEAAIQDLRDFAHTKNLKEAAMAGDDLFQLYEAYLNREEATIPTTKEEVRTKAASAGKWVASLPDWVETHPQTIRLLLIAGLIVLAWQAPAILQAAGEFLRILLGR